MTIGRRRTKGLKLVKHTPPVIAMIEELIRNDLSPEQVSRFLARTSHLMMNYETIYRIFSW